ncbi:hypothetical protein MSAN_00080700 [Mycena sanguinolenta]|uniref:F-box domain-containing protein n=1 Tax=Mycena sanguinolenta TaxID=230812 RepID=A0A8H6ZFX8_9AGAR|nr:hypothetical protein MSAN_00080700 [Mycena sanguinolenta]
MADNETPATCIVQTVPPEIAAKIFTHCLSDSTSAPDPNTAPLLLGRICRDWRNLVQDCPQLWASLKIDQSRIPVSLIETWLSRAQSIPLILELCVPGLEDDDWDAAKFITVFQRHSQTWRDVTLDLPGEQLYLFGSDLPLPLLERLTMTDCFPEAALPCNAFRNAHALRQLTLARAVHPAVLQLPWTEITTFQSPSGSLLPEEFLTILQYTPNIVDCTVTLYNESESDGLPDVAQLAFLASLSLETLIPGALDVFDHISVLALRRLDLSSILFSGRVLVSRLHPFLSRPSCQLRELCIRIDGDKPREDHFIQLLETQPALERLDLVEGSLGLLIAICQRLSDGSPLLPRLTSLRASPHIYPASEITNTFPVMLDALADALTSRWVSDSFAQIQDCTLSWSGVVTDDLEKIVVAFRPRQKQLVALGINMNVVQ